jgi:hypothetical protein
VWEARRRGQDAQVEVQVVPAAERYFGNLGTAAEPGGGGDPEDDGRGVFSAGWGNGHEGAGIEILDVAFVKVRCADLCTMNSGFFKLFTQGGTAHRAPGLGRQNRKQRLGEYAAERGAVLGFAASAAASGAVGGRTKRARGVGVGGSGALDSDETDEEGMETESEVEEEDEEDMDVDALAARVTIVFEGGRAGALPGYVFFHSPHPRMLLIGKSRFKYEPDALREAVMHPRPLLPPSASISPPRARKRQRIDDDDDDDDHDDASAIAPVRCGVELETAVERFLMRMYEADDDAGTDAENEDAESADKSKMHAEDKIPQLGGEVTRAQSDRRRWEIWLLGTLDDTSTREKERDKLPDGVSKAGAVAGGAVLLQGGLRASNLEFVEGEIRVLQDAPAADSGSCAREGWAIEVRRWRWARS